MLQQTPCDRGPCRRELKAWRFGGNSHSPELPSTAFSPPVNDPRTSESLSPPHPALSCWQSWRAHQEQAGICSCCSCLLRRRPHPHTLQRPGQDVASTSAGPFPSLPLHLCVSCISCPGQAVLCLTAPNRTEYRMQPPTPRSRARSRAMARAASLA